MPDQQADQGDLLIGGTPEVHLRRFHLPGARAGVGRFGAPRGQQAFSR
jgi:hypothetical protein